MRLPCRARCGATGHHGTISSFHHPPPAQVRCCPSALFLWPRPHNPFEDRPSSDAPLCLPHLAKIIKHGKAKHKMWSLMLLPVCRRVQGRSSRGTDEDGADASGSGNDGVEASSSDAATAVACALLHLNQPPPVPCPSPVPCMSPCMSFQPSSGSATQTPHTALCPLFHERYHDCLANDSPQEVPPRFEFLCRNPAGSGRAAGRQIMNLFGF